MPSKWILGPTALLGIFFGLLGLVMLTAPEAWFGQISAPPGVWAYNTHFIIDIGIAFLGSGICLLAAVVRPAHFVALAAAGGLFVGGHAILHLALFVLNPGHFSLSQITTETALAVIPGLLPGALVAVFLFSNAKKERTHV